MVLSSLASRMSLSRLAPSRKATSSAWVMSRECIRRKSPSSFCVRAMYSEKGGETARITAPERKKYE